MAPMMASMMASMMAQCLYPLKGTFQALKLWNAMPRTMLEIMDMRFHQLDGNGGIKIGKPVANTLWDAIVQQSIETASKDDSDDVKNQQ